MLALPLLFAVAVKVAVRVTPVPASAPRVPPLTAISPLVKLAPGASLKVNVIVAVWPTVSVNALLVMASVGAMVSKLIDGDDPALPLLPARSAYEFAATVMLALPPFTPAVGVKGALRVLPLPDSAPTGPPGRA